MNNKIKKKEIKKDKKKEFVWGTSLLLLSSGVSCTSATFASLVLPQLTGGHCQTHLHHACLFTGHVDDCPSFSRAQGAPHSLLHVFFNSLFIIQFFFS
jgi:hypothetical protein